MYSCIINIKYIELLVDMYVGRWIQKVIPPPRQYALGMLEGLYGQCLNMVSILRTKRYEKQTLIERALVTS